MTKCCLINGRVWLGLILLALVGLANGEILVEKSASVSEVWPGDTVEISLRVVNNDAQEFTGLLHDLYPLSAEVTFQNEGSFIPGWSPLVGFDVNIPLQSEHTYNYSWKMDYIPPMWNDKSVSVGYATVRLEDETVVAESNGPSLVFHVDYPLECNYNEACEPGENYGNCFMDCHSGSSDGFCDGKNDLKCDPDCATEEDPDCFNCVVNSCDCRCFPEKHLQLADLSCTTDCQAEHDVIGCRQVGSACYRLFDTADSCSAGDKRCIFDQDEPAYWVQECDGGSWTDAQECTHDCFDGECVTRSACSPHVDNGDGTCTAVFNDPVEDGYIQFSEALAPYFFRFDRETVINVHLFSRGYVEWGIYSIPDDATILDTSFVYHTYSKSGTSDAKEMSLRPSVSGNRTIYDDANDGATYVSGSAGFPFEQGMEHVVDLGVGADNGLQDHLSEDWFAIGFALRSSSTVGISSEENTGGFVKPTLMVTYTPSPICGNSITEVGEACDGDRNWGDCDDLHWTYWGYEDCKSDCSGYGDCVPTDYCGDGRRQSLYEECDDGNRRGGDGCSSYCTRETTTTRRSSCFPAGTLISMANGSKNIEDVRVGDLVLGFDVRTDSNAAGVVTGVFSHVVSGYYVIDENLKITATNPIWANGEWKLPGELAVGDGLVTADGELDYVDSIGYIEEEVLVYNLQVDDIRTYYANGLRVHNKALGPIARFIGAKDKKVVDGLDLVDLSLLFLLCVLVVYGAYRMRKKK